MATSVVVRGGVPKNDFLPFYLAAKSVPFSYSSIAAQATAESLRQHQYPMPFVRLPFYALLVRPLALLSYHAAYIAWQVLSALAFLLASFITSKRYPWALLAFAWSAPMASAFVRGQDIAFVLLLLLAAMYLQESDMPFYCGLIIGLCLILKWNLFLTLPIVLAYRFPARARLGATVSLVGAIGASFLIAGPMWPIDYIAVLRKSTVTPSHGWTMPNLYNLIAGRPVTIALMSFLMVGLTCFVVKHSPSVYYALAASCLAGIVVTPHSFSYDCVLLTPFMVAVACESTTRLAKWLAIFFLCPFFTRVLISPLHVIAQLTMIAALASMAIDLLGDKVTEWRASADFILV
jgi:hypothetical protein